MRHIIRERRMCSCTAYRTRSWPKSLSIAAIPSSLKERVYPLSARRCPRTLRASVWSERRQDLRILEGALERVQDLLEGSDLRRPSTGQPQRRSRDARSCVPWLLAHRRDKLRNEESVPRSQSARADDGAGRISVLSDLNDRGKREPRESGAFILFSLRRRKNFLTEKSSDELEDASWPSRVRKRSRQSIF